MAGSAFDLIAMADIARLAGQSRATVGNWKARNEDFPPERGRGPRGPLYDRVEVVAWLKATNRLDERPQEQEAIWQLLERFRGKIEVDDGLRVLLELVALMSLAPDEEWDKICEAGADEVAETIRQSILAHVPFAAALLVPAQLPTEFVAAAVSTLSKFGRDRLPALADAVLGPSVRAVRVAEYLTPKSIRDLVIGLAEPVGSIYNPATGIGQLLVDAVSAFTATSPDSGQVDLFGQELDPNIWMMAQLNLAIRGIKAHIAQGDVFSEDGFRDLRADRVVAVPPWNQKLEIDGASQSDPRWIFGEPGPNDANAAWIQHCLYHLADGGRAVMVMPSAALFEVGRVGRIRQRIIKAGLLDAVIALPPARFAFAFVPSAILVFSKARADRPGEPAVLMVDLSERVERQSRQANPLEDDVIEQVIQTYRQWIAGEPPDMENAAVASFEDIAANDFVIVPARYQTIAPTPNINEARKTRRDLIRRLETLSAAGLHADEQLSKVLGAEK